MSVHMKETIDGVAYAPAVCGLRDYGQLRYAVFDPANEAQMKLFRERIAADQGDLSIGFCWACRGEFLKRFPATAVGRLAPVCL